MPKKRSRRRVQKFKHTEPVEGDLRSDDPKTLLRTHHKLQSAVSNLQRKVTEGNVVLDLSNCEEMDPGGLLLTMYAFAQVWRNDKLSLWFRSSGAVQAYLIENLDHFWESRPERLNEPSDEFLLRQIKNRAEMVQDINQYGDGLRSASYSSDREVAIWETQVGELTTNGFQHGAALDAEKEKGDPVMNMVAGKAYEKRSRVEMGVLDFGAGIPRVIERVAPDKICKGGDGRLIEYALEKGITSRSVSENQGAGLHGIVNAVNENQGRLLLLSGNGLVYVRNDCISSQRLEGTVEEPTLAGTLAIIILNLQGRG